CFQPIKRPPADALESFTCLPAVATDEVLDEQWDVFPPFSQWRHVQGKHIESIEEILAERAVGHSCGQVTIGCGNDADVHPNPVTSSESLEFPLLEHSQAGHLRLG